MIRNRYRRIIFFFARLIIGYIFWDIFLPKIGLRKWSRGSRPERMRKSAVAFRQLAIQLGGVLIKVGQFLSTRVDMLPREVTQELAGLQDEVTPVSFEDVRRVAESAYGVPLEEKFVEFDPIPLASASLGQVHKARLRFPSVTDPESFENDYRPSEVVVKIQRPDNDQVVATDMAALQTVGKWINRYRPIRQRANVPALIEEFRQTLYEEIDYLAEGRNAETFRANFQGVPGIRVRGVVWSHTTRQTLVLENVLAIKITDYEEITAAGVSRAAVASRLLDTYLKQIFEDGFFHADPHPGNLFVDPGRRPQDWMLTFVDFGMVGRIAPETKKGLRELIIAVGIQDAARVVKSYQMLDLLLPTADLAMLERAESQVFDHFWGRTMSELSQIDQEEMREFTREFRDLINKFPFQFPQNLLYVVRVVGILSGICTGLDPDFNLWAHLAPFARKLLVEERNGQEGGWLDELGNYVRLLVAMPQRVDRVLSKVDRGEIRVQVPQIERRISQIESGQRQLVWGIIFIAFFLSGIDLLVSSHELPAAILLVFAGVSHHPGYPGR